MKFTIECPHGVKTTVHDAPELDSAYRREYLRDALLACPECFHTAEAYLRKPGR